MGRRISGANGAVRAGRLSAFDWAAGIPSRAGVYAVSQPPAANVHSEATGQSLHSLSRAGHTIGAINPPAQASSTLQCAAVKHISLRNGAL